MKNLGDLRFESLGSDERQRLLGLLCAAPSRRDFMRLMIAAGATTAAAGGLFASAGKALAETPKVGGKLTLAYDAHGPQDTLDPILFAAGIDYFRGRMFYGSLTRLAPDLSYEPELAEEISANDDATVWTFKIRRGVEFHDGKTLTADDVLYSMNRHLGPDSKSVASALVDMIERWEKVNDYEVRAHLSSPNADLPVALGTFHFKIVQDGQTDFSKPPGTGPYRVGEFTPGVRAIGTRFENYWADGGYLDEMETFAIGDPVARLNAFLAGDIDVMNNLDPKAIKRVEAAEGKEIWAVNSGAYLNIAARQDMTPSNDMHLVKAMQLLMDRNRLLRGVLKGQGSLANDQPIGPAYFDHCPDLPQRVMDPDKAKWHLQQSGIGNSPVEIVAAEVAPGSVEQCLILQREAQKVGLNLQVKTVTTDGYWSSVWRKVPFCVVGWNMRPTANIMLTLGFASDAKWNETAWKDEQFDQLLVAARSVTDPGQRRQMYCDMQAIVQDKSGQIIPVHRNYTDAAASYVKGTTAVPLHNFGGAEAAPFLWRDS
ncbi:MAG: ABC transporter substrate-binding protein [Pseudomonadota bacterium]